jgi:hypothetical protein
MALRNAFEELATENSLIDLVRSNQRGANRAARTVGNADRVSVENVVTSYCYRTYLWDAGTYNTWWATTSVMTVDARQQLSETTRTTSILNRQRWTYA